MKEKSAIGLLCPSSGLRCLALSQALGASRSQGRGEMLIGFPGRAGGILGQKFSRVRFRELRVCWPGGRLGAYVEGKSGDVQDGQEGVLSNVSVARVCVLVRVCVCACVLPRGPGGESHCAGLVLFVRGLRWLIGPRAAGRARSENTSSTTPILPCLRV